MKPRLDHLVVGAASLEQGVAWCEATLGVVPGAGGEHPLMGTHNRLLRIATVDFPRAYLEIIAVQPGRTPARSPRWFDLDDETVRDTLQREGPRLLHFVASVPDAQAGLRALQQLDIDAGEVVALSRMTPGGLLQWRITLRPDGRRLFDGVLPSLIEWGDRHPAAAMPACGVTLRSLAASHPRAAPLRQAFEALGLAAVAVREGPPELCAVLDTPRGRVQLASGAGS